MTCHIENRYAFGKMWCVAVRDCDGVEASSYQDCADMDYKISHGYFNCDCPLPPPPCEQPICSLIVNAG